MQSTVLMTEYNSSNTIEILKQFILIELLKDESMTLSDDQDLLLSGLLDSLNVIRLASHIESEFNISIPPEDMIVENFNTLENIDAYVKGRVS